MRLLSTLAVILCLSLTATAQSDLTISGSLMSGGDITFDVTGAPANATTVVLVGQSGMTDLGIVMIDLAGPFVPAVIGQTDAAGDLSQTFDIPPTMIGMSFSFDSQALSVDFTPGPPTGGNLPFGFVLSDVETATLAL